MDITTHLNNGTCDVTLLGQFTFADHLGFRDSILQKIGLLECKRFILNMARVDFVDSAALGMLLLARDEAEKHCKQLVISGAAGQVKKMFDMARFNTLFSME